MSRIRIIVAVAVGTVALTYAWKRLPASERAYLANVIRQIPDMPGRYAV
jgi:hypothetical protein